MNAFRGRVLQPADDLPGAPSVVVIGHGLWSARFNRDPDVIGRVVRLNGQPFDIVSVAPDWFRGVDMPTLAATQAWIPLRTRTPVLSAGGITAEPFPYLQVKARLRSGITFEEAAADVRTIGHVLDRRDPTGRTSQASHAWQVIPAADLRVHESVHRLVGPLAASALLATVVVLPFFDLIGARFRKGRAFSAFDTAGADAVIVLNETASRRLFGTLESVGRPVTVGSLTTGQFLEQRTVIGVIGDAADGGEPRAESFIPLDQASHRTVLLATTGGTSPDVPRRLERWTLALGAMSPRCP